ncbi:hypothetical protein ACHQM5_007182 [Ranunculus cassubicifolius]
MNTQTIAELSFDMETSAMIATKKPTEINQRLLLSTQRKWIGSLICKLKDHPARNDSEIIEAIKGIWRRKCQGIRMGNQAFLFRFASNDDRNFILSKQPWFCLNSLMFMEILTEDRIGTVIPRPLVPFWIDLDGLLLEHLDWDIIRRIIITAGEVHDDTPRDGLPNVSDGYRVKLIIDIASPLPRGTDAVATTEEGKVWIGFNYVNIPPTFCYKCASPAHVEGGVGCNFAIPVDVDHANTIAAVSVVQPVLENEKNGGSSSGVDKSTMGKSAELDHGPSQQKGQGNANGPPSTGQTVPQVQNQTLSVAPISDSVTAAELGDSSSRRHGKQPMEIDDLLVVGRKRARVESGIEEEEESLNLRPRHQSPQPPVPTIEDMWTSVFSFQANDFLRSRGLFLGNRWSDSGELPAEMQAAASLNISLDIGGNLNFRGVPITNFWEYIFSSSGLKYLGDRGLFVGNLVESSPSLALNLSDESSGDANIFRQVPQMNLLDDVLTGNPGGKIIAETEEVNENSDNYDPVEEQDFSGNVSSPAGIVPSLGRQEAHVPTDPSDNERVAEKDSSSYGLAGSRVARRGSQNARYPSSSQSPFVNSAVE